MKTLQTVQSETRSRLSRLTTQGSSDFKQETLETALQAALDKNLKGVSERLVVEVRSELQAFLDDIQSSLNSHHSNVHGLLSRHFHPHEFKQTLDALDEAFDETAFDETDLVEPMAMVNKVSQCARQTDESADVNQSAPLLSVSVRDEDFSLSWNQPWSVAAIVNTQSFELGAGFLVLTNALLIGLETNADCLHSASGPHNEEARLYQIGEVLFMCCFLAEWLMRAWTYGREWFIGDKWYNCWFDTGMVFIQICDQIVTIMHTQSEIGDLSMIRILRLLRILRVVRLLHIFDELGVIVDSIYAAASALCWAVLLLIAGLCTFSVLFARLTSQVDRSERLIYYFGSVPRTFLTLLEAIIGGISWDEPVVLLLNEVGLFAGTLFTTYVSLGLFVLLNVVTGVFVDKAMRTAQQETQERAVKGIRSALQKEMDEGHPVTIDLFRSKLREPEMTEFLHEMNMDAEDAEELFHIIDQDGSGTIEATELLEGLGRLKNHARVLDIAQMLADSNEKHERLERRLLRITRHMEHLFTKMPLQPASKVQVCL